MAEVCESLEYGNLTYEITVDVRKATTGRTESRLFEGGDMGEVIKRVRRYIENLPNGCFVATKGKVKVTNTFALDAQLIEDMLGRQEEPVKPTVQRVLVHNHPENVLLNSKEAAVLLRMASQTLAYWRCRGIGPRYIIVGANSIRYRREDLMKWIDEQKRGHTSQY